MIVRLKIENPTLEAFTYSDFVSMLEQDDDYLCKHLGNFKFRGKFVYKGTFPDTYKFYDGGKTMEPGQVLIMHRDSIVEIIPEKIFNIKYEVGSI